MPPVQIYLREKNYDNYKKIENKSAVINEMLENYFNRVLEIEKDNSTEIIEETRKKMEELNEQEKGDDYHKKCYDFMCANREEFNKGYKEGKWKTNEEFYEWKQK